MTTPSRRSVFKGSLSYGGMHFPVAIYKTSDEYGLPGHLYHADCGGKVRQIQYCELHPEDDEIITYCGIEIGDPASNRHAIVPVDSALKDILLMRDHPLVVESAHRLADLPRYMIEGSLVPNAVYELTGQRSGDLPNNIDGSHDALTALLTRMRVKKRFLRCRIGLGGLARYAILLPNGYLYTLMYEEEMREPIGVEGVIDKGFAAGVDDLLMMDSEFYMPSLADIDTRVTNWFVKMAKKIVPSKKTAKKETVNA